MAISTAHLRGSSRCKASRSHEFRRRRGRGSAYQAGVLRGIAQRFPDFRAPILTGVSAGALNVAHLANHTGTFQEKVEDLVRLWQSLRFDDVFAVSAASVVWRVTRIGLRLSVGHAPRHRAGHEHGRHQAAAAVSLPFAGAGDRRLNRHRAEHRLGPTVGRRSHGPQLRHGRIGDFRGREGDRRLGTAPAERDQYAAQRRAHHGVGRPAPALFTDSDRATTGTATGAFAWLLHSRRPSIWVRTGCW